MELESSLESVVPEEALVPMVPLPKALEALESEVPSVQAVLVSEVLDALEVREHRMVMASALPEHQMATALV